MSTGWKYPNSINIEITNRCNLKCKFCVNRSMQRVKQDISNDIFHKIINDIKCYPEVNNIIPVGLGEPFLNKNWYELLVIIKKEFPSIPIYIVTNGVLLTQDVIDKISEVLKSDDSLLISLNSGNKEKYRIMMGLDKFECVNKNVNYLLERKKSGNSKFIIKLQYIRLKGLKNFFQLVFFILKWKIRLNGTPDIIFIRQLENWGGKIDTKNFSTKSEKSRYPCPALWSIAMINCEGDIYPCCEQLTHKKGTLFLGNIKDITLKEAFESDKYKKIRENHLNGKWDIYPECRNCDFWSSSQLILETIIQDSNGE